MVGAEGELLGLTVGSIVEGHALGDPGVTVGPAVVGYPPVGTPVVGFADGLPGLTVGPGDIGPAVAGL